MSNESLAVLAAGATVGIATIYCYKQGVKLEDLLEKFEVYKEQFMEIVANLMKLGRELLEKLVERVKSIVDELFFKGRVAACDAVT